MEAAQSFVSSSIRVDNLQNVAILEYRSEAGEVVQQYPTQSQIEAFKNAARLQTEHEGSQQPVEVKAPPSREAAHTPVASDKNSGGSAHNTHSVVA